MPELSTKIFAALLAILVDSPSAEVVCARCHPRESAAFTASAMGRSLGSPARAVPPGKVTQSESGAVLQITWTKQHMAHQLAEFGFRASYSIDYQIGAGKVGYSYISRIGDYLLQSPASYYQRYGWDVSPGFKEVAVLDFDRVLGNSCLFCHSNNPEFLGKRRLAANAEVQAIGCERCHGDTRSHLDHPSRTNVVNPLRLPVAARDSVCEQCHLEGRARVLNPGKTWRDIHPGEQLETSLSVYVDDQGGIPGKVVSQVEQLALSRCARESAGKLWCGTCHNPHGTKTVTRASEVRAICTSCHAQLSRASHTTKLMDCVGCHMPRLRPTDVAHAASTDHRILAKPANAAESRSGTVLIRAWQEPAAEIRQRNLGLAELEAAAIPGFQSLTDSGARLLGTLSSDQQQNDPAVLAALGELYLSRGSPEQSAAFFEGASRLTPSNAEYAMYLGIALKGEGNAAEAARALQNAIRLDASLQRAYLELSALYTNQGKMREAADVLHQYLQWNPQSVLVRSTLDGLR